MDWVSIAERLKYEEKVSWNDIATRLEEETGIKIKKEKIRAKLRRRPQYKDTQECINMHDDIVERLEKKHTIKDLCELYATSERVVLAIIRDLQEKGYNVRENNQYWQISKDVPHTENDYELTWDGNKIIRFGLCGDTHIGSKWTQITLLHRFYDILEQEGIKKVFHTGDIIEGENMRAGHAYECYVHGADDYIDEVCNVYPERKGIITEFITGNHDHSLIKHAGFNIGKAIGQVRNDLRYLGAGACRIPLTPNCILELRHPIGGGSYAKSYVIQKIINAMSGGDKPNILGVGHFHHGLYIPYRNIHAVTTSTFQAQNDWARDKGMDSELGGWIIECIVSDDGSVRRFKSEYIKFYQPLKEDWRNWRG